MALGFGGEVAEFYHCYRHGYPAAVIDALAGAFGLDAEDVVVDLGCGTGQLALPLASRARAVIGMDPEPDMLRRARQAARDAGVSTVSWMLGADADLAVLHEVLGDRPVAMVSIGQALHWMRHEELFRSARPLVRPGGGIAVVTNGTPLWLQDSAWSRGLRGFLERWLDSKLTSPCGTDEESQRRYGDALARAGYEVSRAAVDYVAELWLRVTGRVAGLVVPGVELAVTAHVTDHALAVEGPIREYYLVGPAETADEDQWRTEIGWPIFRTGLAGK
ncbi:MAG TPA: methyltransferase domain-containing protein [Streptosporangiaceae bacterium]|nr:methyltransferase domain-containing protein [Streptosporangiaceae bacterium]